MRIFISLLLTLSSIPAFACNIWFIVNDIKETGEIISMVHKPKVKKPLWVISRADYLTYHKYIREIMLPKYATMNDEDLLKVMSKRYRKTPKQLKQMQIYGMVLEGYLKKGTIR